MAPSPRRRRLRHHAWLAAGGVGAWAITAWLGPSESLSHQLSFATAWVCLVYLAFALSIGPLSVRRTGSAPLNNYLRRDVGIWAAAAGLAHCFLGVSQSMNQVYLARYVTATGGLVSPEVAQQLFTWGSITGLVVAVIILIPLCLSSDRMLRLAGPKWWKRLQRSAYWAFGITVVHALAFQALESRHSALILLLLGAALLVVGLQSLGIITRRRATGAR